VLVSTEHLTRRPHLAGVTAHPAGPWAVQQSRNLANDPGDRPGTMRFLIHDRDPLLTTASREAFTAEGPPIITTLPQTPPMNAIREHVIGIPRRDLPDQMPILRARHWTLVLREYPNQYNGHRPHPSRQQRPPDIETPPVPDVAGQRSARRKPVAGVINDYHHAA
jgi:putative transposase